MKTLKMLSLIILSAIIGIILCFILVINILGYRSDIVNGITGTEIKKIEMGMSFEKVISILGKPYEIDILAGQHDFSCKNPKFLKMSVNENTDIIQIVDSFFNDTYCCDAYKEGRKETYKQHVRLTYTKPVRFSKYYPMLRVYLDSNYHVRNIVAKRCELIDCICIYSLSWKRNTTSFEDIPDKIDFFINEELFEKCFKGKTKKMR